MLGYEGDVHVYAGYWIPTCYNEFLSEHRQGEQVYLPVAYTPGAHAHTAAHNPAEVLWRRGCVVQYADIGRRGCVAHGCDTCIAVQGVETRKNKYHLI